MTGAAPELEGKQQGFRFLYKTDAIAFVVLLDIDLHLEALFVESKASEFQILGSAGLLSNSQRGGGYQVKWSYAAAADN